MAMVQQDIPKAARMQVGTPRELGGLSCNAVQDHLLYCYTIDLIDGYNWIYHILKHNVATYMHIHSYVPYEYHILTISFSI